MREGADHIGQRFPGRLAGRAQDRSAAAKEGKGRWKNGGDGNGAAMFAILPILKLFLEQNARANHKGFLGHPFINGGQTPRRHPFGQHGRLDKTAGRGRWRRRGGLIGGRRGWGFSGCRRLRPGLTTDQDNPGAGQAGHLQEFTACQMVHGYFLLAYQKHRHSQDLIMLW